MKTQITIGTEEYLVDCSIEQFLTFKGFVKLKIGTTKLVSDNNGAYEKLRPEVFWEEKYFNTDLSQITFIEEIEDK